MEYGKHYYDPSYPMVVEEIRKRYSLPEEVLLIDGGTLGIDLLYF